MPELTISDRKKGRQYAAKLEELAHLAPDPFTESKVHQLVAKIRKRYGWSWSLKCEAVVRYVRQSEVCVMQQEIGKHFDWPRRDVIAIVKFLEAEGKVKTEKRRPAGAGPGRPYVFICMVE